MTTQHTSPAHITEPAKADTVTVSPAVDIYENPDEILLVADFAGVSKEQVGIHLDGTELVIEGTQPAPPKGAPYRALSYHRAFKVPRTIDAGQVSAELSGGVLRVHLAKSAAAKPRRIEIQSG